MLFTGHLTHSGLRQRFLYNLNEGREEEILQQDELTTAEMLEEEVHYVRAVSSAEFPNSDPELSSRYSKR